MTSLAQVSGTLNLGCFFFNIRINIRVVKKHHFYHPGCFFRGLVRELHQNPQGFRSIDSFHPRMRRLSVSIRMPPVASWRGHIPQCTPPGNDHISPQKWHIWRWFFLFWRWDMLIPWRVCRVYVFVFDFLFGKLLSFPLAKFNMVHLKIIITLKRKLSFNSIIFGFHVEMFMHWNMSRKKEPRPFTCVAKRIEISIWLLCRCGLVDEFSYTPPKSNIDTQNDGFLTWLFWVSMLDFRGVIFGKTYDDYQLEYASSNWETKWCALLYIIWINLDGSNPSRVMTRKMLIYQVSFFNKTTSAKIFFFPIFFVPPQENFKTSRVDCFKPWFKPFRFVAQQNFKEKAAQLCYSSRDLSLSPLWVPTSHVCKLTIPTRLISQNF